MIRAGVVSDHVCNVRLADTDSSYITATQFFRLCCV